MNIIGFIYIVIFLQKVNKGSFFCDHRLNETWGPELEFQWGGGSMHRMQLIDTASIQTPAPTYQPICTLCFALHLQFVGITQCVNGKWKRRHCKAILRALRKIQKTAVLTTNSTSLISTSMPLLSLKGKTEASLYLCTRACVRLVRTHKGTFLQVLISNLQLHISSFFPHFSFLMDVECLISCFKIAQ